ncbi:MAG: hypothetical protein J6T91_00245 [Alphaproteobacteria bacterium]|nr:hypothetical protein [Alphaproteobacteria bacterium]
MKKVILGVALLFQFSYGVEGVPEFTEVTKKASQSLVPLNFFDNSKAKFWEQLKKSSQSVASEFCKLNALAELDDEERENRKLLTVIDEFETLNIFCKDEFDKNRDKANEAFLHVLAARTKNIMQDEIALKEAEIIRLQGRLDELLKGAPQTAESLSSFDKIIQRAEEDIRTTKEETENFDVSEYELIKKKQITRTFERFNEKLNDIQNEVQEGKDNLEKTLREVFEKTQKQYEDSTNTLLENLEYRYDDIITEVEKSYKDQKKNLAKAYDRQIAIMNDKINEFMALNVQLEKDKELLSLINGVYRSNPDNEFIRSHSFISGNAQEIRGIGDLFVRRSRVEDIYNKVRLFSELLGREDLGVEAKPSDLEAIRVWLDRTSRNAVLAKYGNFPFSINVDGLFSDMSWEKTNAFSGSDIGRPLLNAKGRLEGQISSLNGTDRDVVSARLATIFQRNAADDVVEAKLTRPWHWRQHIYVMYYHKNGAQLGEYWKEYQGRYWGHSWGIFGNVGRDWHARVESPSTAWQNIAKNAFQRDLNATIAAIQDRAKLLFDFETNPESPLQRLYRESGKINPSVIDFPSTEIDALVKQCNEFIKKTV